MSLEKIPPKESPKPHEPSKKDKGQSDFVRGLSLLSQIGISIVVCILIGVFLGRFLDQFFGTSPWLLLIFSLFGAGAAFRYIYDIFKRMHN